MLTVLVPIHGDEDFIVQMEAMPTLANTVADKIYAYNGVYYRRYGDTIVSVIDVEFPKIGHPLELFDYSYEASRMGQAPVISSDTKWFAEEDEESHLFYNLDGKWTDEVHVIFEGQNYYLWGIPTSSKDNTDARFKYEMNFKSHWACVENVYIYDVVAPYIADSPLNESDTFSFYGDITELRKRINAALVKSGLSSYRRQNNNSFFSYKEWNDIPLGNVSDPNDYYTTYEGNYVSYLQGEVYVYENGEFVIDGYQVVIDDGVTSEEKFISFERNFIYDALQKICDDEEGYGLLYYYKHGTKEIHIGDSEYDFGENNAVSYGRYKELLSIKKENTTERSINRMTGIGSDVNIPYYYPNPMADGWLQSEYIRPTSVTNTPIVVDAQPSDVYPSAAATAYEKFLKNRLGDKYEYGHLVNHLFAGDFKADISDWGTDGTADILALVYYFNTKKTQKVYDVEFLTTTPTAYSVENGGLTNPYFSIVRNISIVSSEDGLTPLRVKLLLKDLTSNTTIGEYDSSVTYVSPTTFQSMCAGNTDADVMALPAAHSFKLEVAIYVDEVPSTEKFDFRGYYYPVNHTHNVILPDFYEETGLVAGHNHVYVKDNANAATSKATKGTIIERVEDKNYKDLSTNTIYRCYKTSRNYQNGLSASVYEAFEEGPAMSAEEWVSKYLSLDLKIYEADGWYKNGVEVDLDDYGLTVTGTPYLLDCITFKRLKYVTPQKNLMPEIYIKTDGERRFYNAINYPLIGSSADTASGETISDTVINNSLYKDENDDYYDFESPYKPETISELIKDYDDIKPSIKGMTNTVSGNTFRIDVAAEYAYDEMDDDSVWENENDGNIEGDYKHPHFFIKLRQLPFNLFDMALTEDMTICLTSGVCGACEFKVKVDEDTKKNPVQVWEYDVYEKKSIVSATDRDPYTLVYSEGSLKRYTNKILYRRGTRHTIEVGQQSVVYYDYIKIDTNFSSMYSSDAIKDGLVGSLNTENYSHIEGDVVTSGTFQDCQQDTSSGEVWLALEKDTSTFGMLMPAARPTYNDDTFSIYLRPKSVADTGDEDTADTFVITNIRMPQYYLRYAEHELSKAIIADLNTENPQKFNFSMDFSRIFLAENLVFAENLTENAVLYAEYNHKKYKQYVKSYTYKVVSTEALPEIKVDLNEELSVVFGGFAERMKQNVTNSVVGVTSNIARTVISNEVKKRYIRKNGTAIISGNVVSRKTEVSLGENVAKSEDNEIRIDDLIYTQDIDRANKANISDVNSLVNTTREKVNELVERSNDDTLRLVSLSTAIKTYNSATGREARDEISWGQCIIGKAIDPNPSDENQCKSVADINTVELIS